MKLFEQVKKDIDAKIAKGKKYNPNNSILNWPSSFGEMRDQLTSNIKEDTIEESTLPWHMQPTRNTWGTAKNEYGHSYDGVTHDDAHIKPKKLTAGNKKAIYDYAQAESGNMNRYLRNRMGEHGSKLQNMSEKEATTLISKLSAAFKPESTNKKEVKVFAGIPPRIGKKFEEAEKGSAHTLSGFTSTSTNASTAHSFAESYDREGIHRHVFEAKVMPGAGLSTVHHSPYAENEILLHHGAHVTYHGTDIHHNSDGSITHVHHITVHATHTPLSEYGPYVK